MNEPVDHPIEWHGVTLRLLADRAVHHPAADALLVADLHLGKPASFRAGGVPVPEAVTGADLERLSRLASRTGAGRIVVLGDLVHDAKALQPRTLDQLHIWRSRHAHLEIGLVPGNHDRRAGDLAALGIELLPARHHLAGLDLVHETAGTESVPTLGGHVHPVLRLSARRGDRLRTPCFWFSGRVGILPAFGGFTGGRVMSNGPGDRIFAAGRDEVVPIPGA